MNKNHDPMLRALYIIIVPVVLLIIVLNSGYLQRIVPAARLAGQSYSVVRYNYYYFAYYNSFLEENEHRLDELGYDPGASAANQYTADGLSWKEFFQREAEAVMAETAYYNDLAREAGYAFSEEELLPVQERLAEDAAARAANNLSAKNYYTAYYGSGMTEAAYTAELTRRVEAEAYREYLIRSAAPEKEALAAYIAENDIPDYRAVDLCVITLDALPDRETGAVGQPQMEALAQKLERLAARFDAGIPFEELQAAFSTRALGDRDGVLTEATQFELPEAVAERLFPEDGALLPAGSAVTVIDGGTGYFLLVDGYGGSGAELEAARAIGEDLLLAQAAADIAEGYRVERLRLGMLLATS